MKKSLLAAIAASLVSSFASAAPAADKGKVDWKPCRKELQEYCTSAADDREKHECLEEAPAAGISKACRDHNAKLEARLGHAHDGQHDH